MSILAALVPSRFLYYTDIIKSKEGTLMTKQEISEIKKLFTPKTAPSQESADAMWMERRIKRPN